MPFDPKAFLAKGSPEPSSSKEFDPKAFLAKGNVQPDVERGPMDHFFYDQNSDDNNPVADYMNDPNSLANKEFPIVGGTGRGLVQGISNSLPLAGVMTGGVVGGAAGLASPIPGGTAMGAVGGAAMGNSIGTSTKNFIDRAILGERQNRAKIYGEPLEALPEGAAQEMGGQIIGKGIEAAANTPAAKYLGEKSKGLLAKVGEFFTGVPKQETETYIEHSGDIKKMAKASDNSTAEAADEIKNKFMEDIKKFKQIHNDTISSELENAPKDYRKDVTPIVNALEEQKSLYNEKANPEAIRAIDNLIERVKAHTPGEVATPYTAPYDNEIKLSSSKNTPTESQPGYKTPEAYGEVQAQPGIKNKKTASQIQALEDSVNEALGKSTGKGLSSVGDYFPNTSERVVGTGSYVPKKTIDSTVNAKDLNRIKGLLQGVAENTYAAPGEIFSEATPAARAAKQGGRAARESIGEDFPKVQESNSKLSELHRLEDVTNANLYTPRTSESALMAAGTGGNAKSIKDLKEMGNLIGTDMLTPAQKLAAMRTFGSPKLMVQGTTGKTVSHLLSGSGIGAAAGYAVGGKEGAFAGALAGGAMTSPAALRIAIDSGLITKSAVGELMSSPQGQQVLARGLLQKMKGLIGQQNAK